MKQSSKPKQTQMFKQLLGYLLRYKGLLAAALTLLFLMSVTESAVTLMARHYIDEFLVKNAPTHAHISVLALYYGLFILRIIFSYVGGTLFARLSFSVVKDIRHDAFANVQKLSMRYFDQTPAGSLVSRLTNDTESVSNMFSSILVSFIQSIFIFSVTLYTMMTLNLALTGLVVVFLPIIMWCVHLYRTKSTPIIEATRSRLSDLNVKLSESIDGMRIIQAFRQEERLRDEFEKINTEHAQFSNKFITVDSLFLRPAMSLLKLLAYALLMVYFGVTNEQAVISAGLMYAFVEYINRLFDPLINLTQNFSQLQTSLVSAKRVFDLITYDEYEPTQHATYDTIEQGDIVFENVTFSYDGQNTVLNNVSFSVKKGQTIAFVGHTGSGKSSIINVLMRFYEFDKGQVKIDGQDIRSYSQTALRKHVGLVLQDPFLYHGTIASNIKMYQDITDEQMEAAAKFVDADGFIQQLPKAYQEPVTERGSTLSSGQRQLLAFARTMATDPKILILDEATANIDSETEETIQQSLKKMRQGRTTIAIAHRLSTIQDADCIYVLDKGRIIEQGTHEELLALQGTYQHMYQLQAGAIAK